MSNSTKTGLHAFGVTCIYTLGAIGSIGYDFYCGAKLIGLCSIAVAGMAAPYVVNALKKAGIIEGKKDGKI